MKGRCRRAGPVAVSVLLGLLLLTSVVLLSGYGSVAGHSSGAGVGNRAEPVHSGVNAAGGSPASYTATFAEAGLTLGTSWTVTFNRVTQSGSVGSLAFTGLVNGTYSFTVGAVGGYASSPSSGNIVIAGASTNETITFTVTPPGTYPVTFVESGLPSGSTWSVTFNGTARSADSTVITFYEYDGGYKFSVGPIASYAASPPSGYLGVNGAGLSQSIVFTVVPQGTTEFIEGGLAAGTVWSVTLNGVTQTVSLTSISFTGLANGSYTFSVGSVSGYTSSPSSGDLAVAGAGVSQAIAFTSVSPVTYPVTFSEAGLPSSTAWLVTLDGTTISSTSTTLTFYELNGSYQFSVGSVDSYTVSPPSGSVTVKGAGVSQSIVFTSLSRGTVAFTEEGLATGTPWSVTLNGVTQVGSASTITFPGLMNGSYAFTVGTVSGYTSSPSSGSIIVAGAGATQAIAFTAITYTITLMETGLPAGTSWSATLNAATQSGSGSSIAFVGLVDGSYRFSVGSVIGYTSSPSSGSVTVDGESVSQAITFTAALYPVTLLESGLPSGTSWSVTLNAIIQSGSGSSITFMGLGDGTYQFSVGMVSGYASNPSSGSITVDGRPVNRTIGFTSDVGPFSVTFTQTSLPAGTSWSVTLNGMTETSPAGSIVFTGVVNGTYAFSVGGVSAFVATPSSGTVTVNGSGLTEIIAFVALPTYMVTFTETGVPGGTNWSVTLNGVKEIGPVGSIEFASLLNGTYEFSVGAVDGLDATPSSGVVMVAGTDVSQAIAFTTTPRGAYSVSFTELGLPQGRLWYVNVTGKPSSSSSGTTITMSIVNGSYSYASASSNPSWAAVPAVGYLTVAGRPASVAVTFAYASDVTFRQTGVPTGTSWMLQVTMSTAGPTLASGPAPGQSWFANSTTSTASLGLANGTYSWTVTASGYQTATGTGLSVTGQPVTQSVTVTPSTANSSGPLIPWIYVIIGVVIAAAVAGVAIALVMRSRRR